MIVIQSNETMAKPTHDIHEYIQHCLLLFSSQFNSFLE